jgi:hypothetical protein
MENQTICCGPNEVYRPWGIGGEGKFRAYSLGTLGKAEPSRLEVQTHLEEMLTRLQGCHNRIVELKQSQLEYLGDRLDKSIAKISEIAAPLVNSMITRLLKSESSFEEIRNKVTQSIIKDFTPCYQRFLECKQTYGTPVMTMAELNQQTNPEETAQENFPPTPPMEESGENPIPSMGKETPQQPAGAAPVPQGMPFPPGGFLNNFFPDRRPEQEMEEGKKKPIDDCCDELKNIVKAIKDISIVNMITNTAWAAALAGAWAWLQAIVCPKIMKKDKRGRWVEIPDKEKPLICKKFNELTLEDFTVFFSQPETSITPQEEEYELEDTE